eukprot:gene25003-33507_t
MQQASLPTQTPVATKRTCRTCLKVFVENHERACIFHPESFSGETAQRWLPPGETKGGAEIHNFYSCCGGLADSEGCCWGRHLTFDEPENISFRKPGMGVILENQQKTT